MLAKNDEKIAQIEKTIDTFNASLDAGGNIDEERIRHRIAASERQKNSLVAISKSGISARKTFDEMTREGACKNSEGVRKEAYKTCVKSAKLTVPRALSAETFCKCVSEEQASSWLATDKPRSSSLLVNHATQARSNCRKKLHK